MQNAAQTAGMQFGYDASSIVGVISPTNGGDLAIYTSGTEKVRVMRTTGNVGIGTTSPQNALDIVGAVTVSKGLNASNLNVTGFSITDDSLVTLADGSKKKIKDIKAGEYVKTLDEKTGRIVPMKVNALRDHGVKLTYELTTKTGKAINTTQEHPYLAKLYEQELCDKYAGSVWNKDADNNEFEQKSYCTRWVEVRDLEENDYIAVPKSEHSERQDYVQISPLNNLSINSAVVYTLTSDCCLRCGSLDQIAALMDNASARKSASSKSDNSFSAILRKTSYFAGSKNLIFSSTSACIISNSCSDSFDLNKHSSLCSLSSDLINSGAENLALIDEKRYDEADLGFIIENKTLLSATSFILIPYLSASLLFSGDSLESNSSLLLGDSSASNRLNLPFFAFLPNSTDHSVSSFSSLDSSLLRSASSSDFLCAVTFNSSIIECNSLSTFSNLSKIKASSILLGVSAFDSSTLTSPKAKSEKNYLNVAESDMLENTPFSAPTSSVFFDKIVSIKSVGEQHVYDLSIEGTRNFIANDIVAHNTYLATSSGNVGIGTTAPGYKLTVAGNANISGARFISNSFINFTNNTAFNETLYLVDGNVGIGTTGPTTKLDIVAGADNVNVLTVKRRVLR